MKYRKKQPTVPVAINAIRYHPSLTCEELYEWAGIPYTIGEQPSPEPFKFTNGRIFINTASGTYRADIGDWIIRGHDGQFSSCQNDIFEATYELCEKQAHPNPHAWGGKGGL